MSATWGGRRSVQLRIVVIARDRGVCHLCLLPGADSVDHLVPVGRGGAVWELDNLAAAHFSPCNAARGKRVLTPALVAAFRTPAWRSRVVGHAPIDARASFEGW